MFHLVHEFGLPFLSPHQAHRRLRPVCSKHLSSRIHQWLPPVDSTADSENDSVNPDWMFLSLYVYFRLAPDLFTALGLSPDCGARLTSMRAGKPTTSPPVSSHRDHMLPLRAPLSVPRGNRVPDTRTPSFVVACMGCMEVRRDVMLHEVRGSRQC